MNDVKSLVEKAPQQLDISTLINKSIKELGKALPSHLSAERLARIALTCIRLTPDLARTTPESFLGSLFVLAQLGLEPVAGRAYLLPFNNSRKMQDGSWKTLKECQVLIGYKGLIELFYRHNSALSIDMQTVHENDMFDYEYGTNSYIKHKPALKERGEILGFYCVAKMQGGASVFKFMSIKECLEHGKNHSKTFDKKKNEFYSSSPWSKEPEAMCKKTVLIQLSKLLPLSVELQKAILIDESSRDFKPSISDALDLPVTTQWENTEQIEVIEDK